MPADRFDRLTKRQRECLRLVGEMRTSKEIAGLLGISSHTVDGHINEGVATLAAGTRYEAARLLAEHDTPRQLTGQPSPVAVPADPPPSVGHTAVGMATPQGRMIRLGGWQRIGIIVGLAIGSIYAVVLLLLGSEVIDRYARHAPPSSIGR